MFATKLKQARKKAKLTQLELANRIEKLTGKSVGEAAVGHWETGRTKPSFDNIKAICSILDSTPEYLLSENEEPLSEKELSDAFIDLIIDQLYAVDEIKKGQKFQDLSESARQMLIAAIDMHVSKRLNGK